MAVCSPERNLRSDVAFYVSEDLGRLGSRSASMSTTLCSSAGAYLHIDHFLVCVSHRTHILPG